jgi:hypothetical protein
VGNSNLPNSHNAMTYILANAGLASLNPTQKRAFWQMQLLSRIRKIWRVLELSKFVLVYIQKNLKIIQITN